MKTIKINAYRFKELSDKAKANAMDTYYSNHFDETWYDFIEEDAKTFKLSLDGFQIDRRICDLSFVDNAEETAKAIMCWNLPEESKLLEHAREWILEVNSLFKTYNSYDSYISWLNENGMVEDDYDFDEWVLEESGYQDDKVSVDSDFLRQLEYEFLEYLESEYEHICSEEYISGYYDANEWLFDINGNIISYE